ncbi:MAG: hypothetical protein A3G80_04390 [Betaproteobacteria bacterium RIFCSPLOWO2_12_FULL_62_13b]|nr:MAG: hypothetical protein A3G80_04390 [Betaproteobacteria bacterium RIFCSPLOWO2_12_FULL_62_13b]
MGIAAEQNHQSNQTTGSLYERDFCAWAEEQVRLLAERRFDYLDLDHLTEEIRDMGNEQVFALESALIQALVHLTKLAYSPAKDPRSAWKTSVTKHRVVVERLIRRNPSLKSKIDGLFADAWGDARKIARAEMEQYGEVVERPEQCPFNLAQLRSEEFWPVEGASATPSGTKGLGR